MTEKKTTNEGKSFPPGSAEDAQLTVEILGKFFSAKQKAADLHRQGGPVHVSTATKSVCNIDGTTDGDDATE